MSILTSKIQYQLGYTPKVAKPKYNYISGWMQMSSCLRDAGNQEVKESRKLLLPAKKYSRLNHPGETKIIFCCCTSFA